MEYTYKDVAVTCNEDIPEEEAQAYVERCLEKKPGLYELDIKIDGDYADLAYRFKESGAPFERIRRITGYLVGTLDRFNDGKRAEEADRVKHDI